jgi:SAM-dependent MidA family methyltransferase
MQEWLYGNDGYYSSFKTIGKEGDFYTSVSASPFFGGSIAKRIIKTIEEGFLPKDLTILEIGAHQGYLLADIIQFIYTLKPKLLETLNFAILEKQENLLEIQKEYMKNSFGNAIKLSYFKSFDEIDLDCAFIISNEIFDAFACEVVKDDKMLCVENFEVDFCDISPCAKKIAKRYDIKKGEVAIGYEEFAFKLSKSIKKFEFVTFDYGEKEIRGDFSLRIYDKHKTYPFFSLTKFAKDKELEKDGIDLKKLFKKSDITYDVNFSHLIDAFSKNGIKKVTYKTQNRALVDFGIIELLEILRKNSNEKTYLNELGKAKVLIDPAFMGERFKCLIFRFSAKVDF